jgi:DNA-binding IclR family transcriptional regulator
MSKAGVQVLGRSIDILMLLADGPKTLTQMVRASAIPKGTVFRLLSALQYRDMVLKDSLDNTYVLGPGFLWLMQSTVDNIGASVMLDQSAALRLWELTQETILVHIRMGTARVCVKELPSPQAIRYTASVGTAEPLQLGSAGKVLLAFMPDAQRERLLSRLSLYRLTPQSITDIDVLLEEVELTRTRGWAVSEGERVSGAAAISVPVFAPDGALFSLSVVGPGVRFPLERRMEIIGELQAAAAEMERGLGGGRPLTDGDERPLTDAPRRNARAASKA